MNFFKQKYGVWLIFVWAILNTTTQSWAADNETETLEQRVGQLEREVTELKQVLSQLTATKPAVTNSNVGQSTTLLTMKRWFYREENLKFTVQYAIDVELFNGFDKAIKEIDARVKFKNLFGGLLYTMTISSNLPIASGTSVIDKGTLENGRLLGSGHQMRRLKNDEITAELTVRRIVFEDNSVVSF